MFYRLSSWRNACLAFISYSVIASRLSPSFAGAQNNTNILLQIEEFRGTWRRQTNIKGYTGSGFCTSNGNPKISEQVMTKSVQIEKAGDYHVWARGFQGADVSENDRRRAFQIVVGGKRLGATHKGGNTGWSWQKAGSVELKAGPVQVQVHDADVGWETADAVLLTTDDSLDAEAVDAMYDPNPLSVLGVESFGVSTDNMMLQYLTDRVDLFAEEWAASFEKLKTKEDIRAYQNRLRTAFLDALGPFPERTPLNAQVTGVLKRDGYRIEKTIFESRPKHYVSALCFVPESEKHKAPYPGVLVPCGHSNNGKAFESYQTMGALLALNGMVALVFDPVEQGERLQVVDENGKSDCQGTHAHNRIGVASVFVGWNTATFEVWDGMRGIDYLQSREDVNGDLIGCTGNSGGGTQTSYLMSLEDRIDVAGPSCYITSFERLAHTLGGQDAEQNIYGQLAFGMDHADYITMRAPSPVILAAGIKDFFDINGTRRSFQYAKRMFTKLGAPDNVAIFENDAGHNYNTQQREAIVSFFVRYLTGSTEPVVEPAIRTFTDQELRCSARGQVMLMEGARSVYDLLADRTKELSAQRKRLWQNTPTAELLEQVRELAVIRKLNDLPAVRVEKNRTVKREGYVIEKLIFYPEEDIALPALRFVPSKASKQPAVLYLHQQGKHAHAHVNGAIEKLVLTGRMVLALDVRGSGETQHRGQGYFSPEWGDDGRDVVYAFLLARPYVGMRAEDILVCTRYLLANEKNSTGGIEMISFGNLGVPALHAAAMEPDLFSAVTISGMVISWTDVASSARSSNQMVNFVHGALRVYDLDNLAKVIGRAKLNIIAPADVHGRPLE